MLPAYVSAAAYNATAPLTTCTDKRLTQAQVNTCLTCLSITTRPDTGTGVGGAGLDKPRCGSVMVQQADGACRELHLLSAAPPATGVPALAATPPPSLRLLTDHGAALPLYADCPRVPWRGQGVLHLVRERCRSSPKPLYAVSVIAQAAEMLSGCATPRAM